MGSNTAVRRNAFLPLCETLGEEEEQDEEGKVAGNGENTEIEQAVAQDEKLITRSSLEREIF